MAILSNKDASVVNEMVALGKGVCYKHWAAIGATHVAEVLCRTWEGDFLFEAVELHSGQVFH